MCTVRVVRWQIQSLLAPHVRESNRIRIEAQGVPFEARRSRRNRALHVVLIMNDHEDSLPRHMTSRSATHKPRSYSSYRSQLANGTIAMPLALRRPACSVLSQRLSRKPKQNAKKPSAAKNCSTCRNDDDVRMAATHSGVTVSAKFSAAVHTQTQLNKRNSNHECKVMSTAQQRTYIRRCHMPCPAFAQAPDTTPTATRQPHTLNMQYLQVTITAGEVVFDTTYQEPRVQG